jgi:serine/threonine-protein kinase
VSWRGLARRFLPFLIAAAAGFLIAYLVVALVIFPAGIVPDDAPVPNVVGLSYDEAETKLKSAGFKAERGATRFHATSPRGTVLTQQPPAGSRELLGTAIQLELSGGQRMAVVPTLAGLTQRDAEVALDVAGLEVGDVREQAGNLPRGEVLETSPAAGMRVPVPSAVALVLSSGPADLEMPDVVGRDVGSARTLVEQLGLRVRRVDYDPDAGSPANTVIEQTPAAGGRVNAGASVTLRVAGRMP